MGELWIHRGGDGPRPDGQVTMDTITIALAQIVPVWFDREKTLAKVADSIAEAAASGADLVAFGEALVPGYPFWIEYSKETAFNSSFHKAFHAEYIKQAVVIERGDLDGICRLAAEKTIAVYLGHIERPGDRGESLYASLVYINKAGAIGSGHRPTTSE